MTFLLFILLLLVIVVIHEFGHLIMAKIFNVYCHEFSFGFGPLLFKKKFKETTYSLRAIPLGGYVAMAGDSDNPIEPEVTKNLPPERTLTGIHPLKKLCILYAGIFMNIVLALLISSMVFLSYGEAALSPDNTIASVVDDSVAYRAGIKEGDIVKKIELPDGSIYGVSTFSDISAYFSLYKGEGEITFTIERNGSETRISFTPEYNQNEERYMIGIGANQAKIVDVNIINCWKYGTEYIFSMTGAIISSLLNIFRGIGLENMSGPVGIYSVTGQAIEQGFDTYLLLIAMISLNVGVVNFLPIPVMDGGRGLITIVEMIIGRPINKKVSDVIMSASTILLLVLFALMTIKDIRSLF